MKCAVILCVLAVLAILAVNSSQAQPVGAPLQLQLTEEAAAPEHSREKRATCDLLSLQVIGVGLKHSACAAHCLAMGKKGGYCNDRAVCVCR